MRRLRRALVAPIVIALLASIAGPVGAVLEPEATTFDDAQTSNGGKASISDDGRFIAYISGDEQGVELFDASTGGTRSIDAAGFTPAISGDGSRVAYARSSASGFQIVVWTRTTGTTQILTTSSQIAWFPSISADGGIVAWVDQPSDIGTRSVQVWRRSTGNVEVIPSPAGLVQVSANGRYLFYTDPDADSVRRDLTTGAVIQLLHFPADVSDNGGRYAYVPADGGLQLGVGRHTIATGRDDVLEFTDDVAIGPRGVRISGDGATLFFNARPDIIASDTNDNFDLYRWLPDADSLDWTSYRNEVPEDVSTDGSVVVTSGAGSDRSDADGSSFTRLEFGEFVPPPPTPDPVSVEDLAQPQLTDQVTRIYGAFFLRSPDPGGLAFWRTQRASGVTVAAIADNFVRSPEFVETYGPLSNAEFVDLVYRNLFERAADPGGRSFWIGQLDSGRSRGSVMVALSESPENVARTETTAASPGQAHQIWRLYRAYFLRDADQDGFDFWYAQAFNGRSATSISEAFARSPEFVATYGALSDADFVDLVYDNVLGRLPDAPGRQFWLDRLAGGSTRGAVMLSFSESLEYIRATDTLPR